MHDQDVLNFIGEGKTLLLPFHWNVMRTEGLAKYLPEKLKNEYYDAEQNPKIIHYKPWLYDKYILSFELFWKYATRTPFSDVIIKRMKENGGVMNEPLTFRDRVIDNITHRKGMGILFILECLKAWLFRDKPK
jgi:lipopolysaccharide biosynthesis glycosyltransferase